MTRALEPSIHSRPITLMRGKLEAAAFIAFGVVLSLCMQGYQFGVSNHTVYLVDALRHVRPELLANDWYTTQTLQYHAAFGWMTRGLMRAGVVASAFLVGYLALLILLHAAWWRWVKLLGGGAGVFVVSEILFHVSAGGTALGMYQFMQDAEFLPSNIAAVALLWGLVLWLDRRIILAGICFGMAGLFHLNYALVGIVVWGLLHAGALGRDATQQMNGRRWWWAFGVGTIAAMVPSAINIGFALHAAAQRSGVMPLKEFVDLYVRLRHPHHYDPSSWPIWLWLSFLWPMPIAALMWVRMKREGRLTFAWVESGKLFAIFSLLLVAALIGAGIVYVSESLVQASLYRFSIFLKLLSCIAAAFLLIELAAMRGKAAHATAGGVLLGLGLMIACVVRGPYLGLFRIPADEPSYLAACDWISQNTPTDAIFLVPPSEQEFRLRAQRAIVVNFKGVPQFSGEMIEWRDRMQAALDLPDLRQLPRPFPATLAAIRARYESLPPETLQAVAQRYGARYILVGHRLPPAWEPRRVAIDVNPSWFLYDLAREKEARVDVSDIQKRMLEAYGIRVEPAMGRYVLRNLLQAGAALRELPVIGGNARTGTPVRLLIDPSKLQDPASPPA